MVFSVVNPNIRREIHMKKMLIGLLFGLMVVSSSAFATVNCDGGVLGCTSITPAGDAQPAVTFEVLADQMVFIHADIWAANNCDGAADGSAEGTLPLQAGQTIVYLNFYPPLPPATSLSIKWKVDNCPVTDCVTYTIGADPPACGAGASANASSLDVQY